jgi:hypothetical protein
VGSEMCIRDSYRPVRRPGGDDAAPPADPRPAAT